MQALPGLVSILALALMMLVYRDDTPQGLVARGRTAAASAILLKIYSSDEIEAQDRLEELLQSTEEKGSTESGFFSMLKRPGCLQALLVGCILSIGQQAGGINAFVARSTKIFQDAGMTAAMTKKMSTIMTAVNVFMTFPAIFIVDKLGRKPLLLIGMNLDR